MHFNADLDEIELLFDLAKVPNWRLIASYLYLYFIEKAGPSLLCRVIASRTMAPIVKLTKSALQRQIIRTFIPPFEYNRQGGGLYNCPHPHLHSVGLYIFEELLPALK